jgi:16S rRNA (guanine(527)-N(7))-methyltransferase RsmG
MDLIQKYFVNLSQKQIEQFSALEELYGNWNKSINVISRKDIDNLYERHVLHSLAIAKFISFKPGTKVADLGTGGGFPGVPLAILFPDVSFLLVDSIGKKVKVVEEVSKQLGLANVKVKNQRIENIPGKYDFLAKFISFKPGTKVADLGTGGGFPGVPLAILFPDVSFLLVDSIGKKVKVVEEVSRQLGLGNVKVKNQRIENIPGKYDFFVSRAVTRLDTAWGWVSNKIDNNNKNDLKNGLIYLKGGDISTEIPNNTFIQKEAVSTWFTETFFEDKGLVYITKI